MDLTKLEGDLTKELPPVIEALDAIDKYQAILMLLIPQLKAYIPLADEINKILKAALAALEAS